MAGTSAPSAQAAWPPLPYDQWRDTKETLHRYVQIVGKVRLRLAAHRNHWWHVPLYVWTRGLTTSPMPYRDQVVEVQFDLLDHRLVVITSTGARRSFPLYDGLSVAAFYERFLATLIELGVEVSISPQPFDLPGQPYPADDEHASYDAEAVGRYRRVLLTVDTVLQQFSGRFLGKTSPVHLFWHSFDLALTRFSGRTAPLPPQVDPVTAEAYSHEVISFGFWAGDDRTVAAPCFYSYTAPKPEGLATQPLRPAAAEWRDGGALALLRYDDVRATGQPQDLVLDFLQSAYEAGGHAAGWDLAVLADPAAEGS